MTRPASVKKIRTALIGYGYWGPKLARNLAADPACDLRVICDRRLSRRLAAAVDHPGAALARSPGGVFKMKDIDAVVIATPPASHYALVRRALVTGRHVMVEKPFTLASSHACELIRIAGEARKVLLVGHTYIYSPRVASIKKFLSGVGGLRRMNFWRLGQMSSLAISDPGALWDLCPHDISIAMHLTGGRPVSVRAAGSSRSSGHSRAGTLCMEFPGNVQFKSRFSWIAPGKVRRAVLEGENWRGIYDDTSPTSPVRIFARGRELLLQTGDAEPLAEECRDFFDCVRTGKMPKSSGAMGLEIVRILEAAETSAANSGEAVFIR